MTTLTATSPLAIRLALILALIGLAYTLITIVLLMTVAIGTEKADLQADLHRIAATLSAPAAQAVYELDHTLAAAAVSELEAYHYVRAVEIDDDRGARLTRVDFVVQTDVPQWLALVLDEPGKQQIRRPLHDSRFGDGRSGLLVIEYDMYAAMWPPLQRLLWQGFTSVVMLLLLVLCIYVVLHFLVTRPLRRMAHQLKQIAPDNPAGQRLPVRSARRDELSELADGFNAFVQATEENIESRHLAEWAMTQINLHLEETVEQRTHELKLAKEEAERQKEEAERLRDKADAANRAKSQFLSNMSHELRTPLNAIVGFTRRLLVRGQGVWPEKDIDALGRVARNSDHLLLLINDLLDIAKIEADKLELSYDPGVDLKKMVADVVEELSAMADEHRILLVNSFTVPQTISADPIRLRQILINLIGNAIKYTERGEVCVDGRLSDEGSEMLVIVRDTGIGIAPQDMPKLFDPYNHIHSSINKPVSIQSTGLGLPLTKKLVLLHGGRIDVSSEPGRGSEFTVCLPRQRPLRVPSSASAATAMSPAR